MSQFQASGGDKYSAPELLERVSDDMPNYQKWIAEKFASVFVNLSATSVMDFGAGTGILAKYFKSITNISPVLLEIDEGLRASCENRGFKTSAGLNDVKEEFDFIYSSNVLEHIEDDLGVLVNLREKLNKNGALVMFLPAFPILWSPMDVKVGHFRRYTVKNMEMLLNEAGFSVSKIEYCDSVGFFVSLLYKFMPAADGEPSAASLKFYDSWLFPISKVCDTIFKRILGKNIFFIAVKDAR
ncbi:MAG: class I SAM-dependent methyltransferase [Comamonas sp.]|uniref:class I SAM-dependent methyltransferase n=1 Tax=Comamonas sp. TaxID=34028 RepID=UPI003D144170